MGLGPIQYISKCLSVPEASEEAVTATVQAGVLKACVQRGPDRLVQQVRGHERARRLIS